MSKLHRASKPLCAVNLDNALDTLPTDRTKIHLLSTSDTSTDMSTITKDGVLLFRVTDLTEIHFLISDLQVMNTLSMSLSILVPTNILITGRLLDISTRSMAHIFDPIAVVCVASGILHFSLPVAPAEHEVAFVDRSGSREVFAMSVVVAFEELAAIEVVCECCF